MRKISEKVPSDQHNMQSDDTTKITAEKEALPDFGLNKPTIYLKRTLERFHLIKLSKVSQSKKSSVLSASIALLKYVPSIIGHLNPSLYKAFTVK